MQKIIAVCQMFTKMARYIGSKILKKLFFETILTLTICLDDDLPVEPAKVPKKAAKITNTEFALKASCNKRNDHF